MSQILTSLVQMILLLLIHSKIDDLHIFQGFQLKTKVSFSDSEFALDGQPTLLVFHQLAHDNLCWS